MEFAYIIIPDYDAQHWCSKIIEKLCNGWTIINTSHTDRSVHYVLRKVSHDD